MDKLEKLEALSVGPASDWIKKAKERQKNRKWLNHSGAIALRILRTLRAKNMTQQQLADAMGVSAQQVNKIVKGSENLSLETISKIETALGVALIHVPEVSGTKEVYTPAEKVVVACPSVMLGQMTLLLHTERYQTVKYTGKHRFLKS